MIRSPLRPPCHSLIRGDKEINADDNATSDDSIERLDGSDIEVQLNEVEKKNEAKDRTKNEPIKSAEKEPVQVEEEESMEAPNSQPIGYFLKHRINEKLIEGLVENHRGPIYEAILKKKITKKEDIGGNLEIPCNIGGLKYMNALVEKGSDMNVMPLSTYKKLTDKRLVKTNIRISLSMPAIRISTL
ncbi:hypothetical protein Tco_0041118 [Tanacetum coccineum]